ncbi:hypothetical protein pb186bvf_004963 [Paramecium bursaria]
MQELDQLEQFRKINQVQIDWTDSFLITLQNGNRINIYSIKDKSLIGKDLIFVDSFIIYKNLIHSMKLQQKKLVQLNYKTQKIRATFFSQAYENIIFNDNLVYLRNLTLDFMNHKNNKQYLRAKNYKQIRKLKQTQFLGGNYQLIFNDQYKNKMQEFISCKDIKFKLDQLELTLVKTIQELLTLSDQSTQYLKVIKNNKLLSNTLCYQYDMNAEYKLVVYMYRDKKKIYLSCLGNAEWFKFNARHKILYFKILDYENLQGNEACYRYYQIEIVYILIYIFCQQRVKSIYHINFCFHFIDLELCQLLLDISPELLILKKNGIKLILKYQLKAVFQKVINFINYITQLQFMPEALNLKPQPCLGGIKLAPYYLQDNPYLLTGYRINYDTPKLALSKNIYQKSFLESCFHLHNEFNNIWTHLIAFLVTIVIVAMDYLPLLEIDDNLSTWPIKMSLMCSIIMYGISTVYHIFMCCQQSLFCVLLKLDYAGISFMALACIVPVIFYGYQCDPTTQFLYTWGIIFLCLSTCLISWSDFMQKGENHIYKTLLFITQYAIVLIPELQLIYHSRTEQSTFNTTQIEEAMLKAVIYIVTGLIVFTQRFPERWIPSYNLACNSVHLLCTNILHLSTFIQGKSRFLVSFLMILVLDIICYTNSIFRFIFISFISNCLYIWKIDTFVFFSFNNFQQFQYVIMFGKIKNVEYGEYEEQIMKNSENMENGYLNILKRYLKKNIHDAHRSIRKIRLTQLNYHYHLKLIDPHSYLKQIDDSYDVKILV